MKLALRPASVDELGFCAGLHRSNMSAYMSTRNIIWEPALFLDSWREFENLIVMADDRAVGLLRLLVVDAALEIRDLQVAPANRGRGIGSWAVQQAKSLAAQRGLGLVRLRVFEENPARVLYRQLGFDTEAVVDGKVHMSCRLPPHHSIKPHCG